MQISEYKFISEIFLAFNGEPCILTFVRTSQLEFRPNQNRDLFSSKADFNVNESPGDNKQLTSEECHPMKRAIIESILDDYGQYQKIVDQMRAEHISLRRTRKLNEILTFAHIWSKRLRFIRALFSLIGSNDGIQLINLFYQKTTFLCHLDWEYGLLMNAIVRSSNEFNNICSKWLLDASFSDQINWTIKVGGKPIKPSPARSVSTLDASITSLQSVELDLSKQTMNKLEFVKDDFSKELSLPVIIQNENVPESFNNCKELIEMIMDIGRKVHFLKVLRSTRFYEFAREERLEIIQRYLISAIWHDPTHRSSLCIVLHKLNDIVCDDMRIELIQNHRMIDHLILVHAYFFMLRGDLFAELERLILVSFGNSTICHKTPKSIRKGLSAKMKMIEDILNNALKLCSPPQNIADLILLLSSERCRDRSKTLLELFSLTYTSSSIRKKLSDDGPLLSPMSEFFSKQVMKIYKKVFSIVSNFQMLRFYLDEVAYRFTNIFRKTRRRKGISIILTLYPQFLANNQPSPRVIFGILHKLRLFLARLGNYIFDEVLILQSTSILKTVRSSQDPYNLLNRHKNLLSEVMRSLFIYPDAAPIHNIFMQSLRDGRSLLFEIEDMCNLIDEGKNTIIHCYQHILHKHQLLQTTIFKLLNSCIHSPKFISCFDLDFVEDSQIQWKDMKTGG
uniref:Gamma-tubulin complex component n=1 Tax=Meloidogyne hapla TaxID=6305 RepID=A0A1I8BU34_MELHA